MLLRGGHPSKRLYELSILTSCQKVSKTHILSLTPRQLSKVKLTFIRKMKNFWFSPKEAAPNKYRTGS
jgi:hypothetical protein